MNERRNVQRRAARREANSAGNAIVAIVVADIVSYNWYCGSTLLLYTPITKDGEESNFGKAP
jgi:hypothetical protein